MKRILMLLVVAGLMGTSSLTAKAGPIDLNDFLFADPTVMVALDGSEATFAEDPSLSPVLATQW